VNPSKISSTYSHNDTGRVMTTEEFDQVIEAIALGRYSWACVLILRIAGYNPLHYLPYRTYRRLIKENAQVNLAGSRHPVANESVERLHSY
jgi:hypothetical protein